MFLLKKSEIRFVIVAVYVDDLNLIGTPEKISKTDSYLKNELEMNDLGKTKFYRSLQIEYFPIGILLYQSTYTKKV